MLPRTAGPIVVLVTLTLLFTAAPPASAQVRDPNAGQIRFGGGLDITNAYLFRGLRQDDTGVIFFPSAEAAIALGDIMTFKLGTWNSLNTGDTGSDGPSGELWYESDIYGTLEFDLAAFIVSATYTAYLSPNNSFTTIKEFSFKGSMSDADLGGVTLNPYALVAFEFDTAPGIGQADGGLSRGTYLEIGVLPAWTEPSFSVTFPIRVGLSLDDYYELAGVDHTFGYLNVGAIGSFPLMRSADYGALDVQGTIDFYSLGETPEAFNGGDQNKLVFSAGLRFRY